VTRLLPRSLSFGIARSTCKAPPLRTNEVVVSRSWWKKKKASFSGELIHNSHPLRGGGRRMTPWEAIAKGWGERRSAGVRPGRNRDDDAGEDTGDDRGADRRGARSGAGSGEVAADRSRAERLSPREPAAAAD